MRISDWISDVCSSDLDQAEEVAEEGDDVGRQRLRGQADRHRHGAEEQGAADHQQGGAGVGCGGHGVVGAEAGKGVHAGAASAATFSSLPCEGRGGLEGCLLDQLEPWAPPPSLPLPSQGEGQELAAEAAPTRTSGKAGMAHQCAPMMRGSGSSITPKRSCTDAVMRRASASSCRSEEHTSELQSLMRISYAVFCLK